MDVSIAQAGGTEYGRGAERVVASSGTGHGALVSENDHRGWFFFSDSVK